LIASKRYSRATLGLGYPSLKLREKNFGTRGISGFYAGLGTNAVANGIGGAVLFVT